MSTEYLLRIRDAFFGKDSIQRTAHACVYSLSLVVSDPLTIFGNVAIQYPLNCTLTTDGFCPFRADYRIAIPYASMSAAQLELMREIAAHISGSSASINCKHTNGTFSVSMAREDATVYADAATVLFGINVLIIRAVGAKRIAVDSVLNVTQQHIMATTALHRSQIARATEMTRRYQNSSAAEVENGGLGDDLVVLPSEERVEATGRDSVRLDVA
jgi:hypothetical protein